MLVDWGSEFMFLMIGQWSHVAVGAAQTERLHSPLLDLSSSPRCYVFGGIEVASMEQGGIWARLYLLRFGGEDQILINCIWHYLMYPVYDQMRGARERSGAEVVASALRVQVRSLSTRPHNVAIVLGAV